MRWKINWLFTISLLAVYFIAPMLSARSASGTMRTHAIGYWANWSVSDGFDIRLRDVDERYDTILVAFAEGDTDAHLTFIPEPSLYSSPEDFRADVDYLKSRGHTVIISVGGAEGSFPMETAAQRDECVNSLKEIIDFYHFDGFDIDLEGGRISLDAGDTDLQNPTTPKILNWIEAIREVHSYMESQGKDPVITVTPEVAYVQGGLRSYSGIWGAYLPVIHGAREFITSVNVQYYNTAGMYGLDGELYTPDTDNPDFLVAMTDMLIEGFHPLGSKTPFLPLREDQIGFGYPVWDGTPIPTIECVTKALNYIVAGESYGGDYVLSNPDGHLSFHGVFHWNINWDKEVWDYGYIAQLRPLIDSFNEKSCQCIDGLDNDGDGLVDMDDPGCLSSGDRDEYNAPPQCDDGIDNDGDGVVDMEDPDCECATDNSEGPEPIPAWNGNGIPYSVGDLVSYQGNIYRCVSEHASLPNWDPIHAPTLWEEQEGPPPPTPIAAPTAIPAQTVTPPSIPDPTVPAIPSPTPVQVSPSTGYSVSGSRIFNNNGDEVPLYGVNWFGFETENHVPHGLWTRNWQSMIEQIKGLGFNAIRLPICPDTLRGVTPTSIDYYANPDLTGKNSLELLDLFMAEFSRQGIYVLLDHHRPDCNAISELWYTGSYSEENWIDDLVFLADRYADNSHLIGIDIKNEPHGAATWGTGNNATDFNKAAERAAAAILGVNPDILIFVEGIETNPVCSGTVNHWWGGNLEPQNCYPLDIPADRLVFSPHVYGPDVWAQPYFADPNFPENMPAIWDAHFGYLADEGRLVVPGEFGGRYGHDGDPNDIILQDALVDYFVEKDITTFFYWSWNPNSGDTGGILQDDWTTVWEDKVDLLHRLMGDINPSPTPNPTATRTPAPITPESTVIPLISPTPGSSTGFPDRVFAPYVDVCIYPRFFIIEQNQAMETKYYTLAFVVSDSAGNGIPTWGGYMEYETSGDWYRDEINGIRAHGGDIIVSFGGEAGIELAMAHNNIESLQAAYQSVIDTYSLTWVDFDIEGAAVSDQDSIDRRNKAIKLLQDDNPNLKVVFCLPVIPSGLTLDGMNLLRNAIANGVRVDGVNIMAMYFGASAPNPDGRMGEYAIEAANSLFDQLKTLYPVKTDSQLWQMVGVTPVIGRSTATEVFYLADAQKLVTFGLEKNINLLSMWSANRDNGSCGTIFSYSPLCSSLEQEDFAFSLIFEQFTGQSGPPTPTPSAPATPIKTATPPAIPTPTVPAIPSPTVKIPTPTPRSIETPTPRPTATMPVIVPPTPAPTTILTATPKPTATGQPALTPSPGEIPVLAHGDYNGDGSSDIALFRPSTGLWAIRGITRCYFGSSEDIPASGDYNGDGTGQIAIFRPATGLWAIKDQGRIYFGRRDDTPVPADYNGNGKDDIFVYRPATGLWAIRGVTRAYFGGTGDIPLPGDYNGAAAAGIAIFRPSSGLWSIRGEAPVYFGRRDDTPVPADYTGDGINDLAIFRPVTGLWAIKDLTRFYFGRQDDRPIPADYDGAGDCDIAIFRAADGFWAIRGVTRVYYGSSGDIPVVR